MSAYNGSGTFVVSGVGLPYVTGTTISSTVANTLNTDLATGLSTAICKDGQTTVTANIPLGGFKLTGIAVATATGDALSYGRAATVTTLTATGLLDISGASAGQIKFPAAQDASANVNTLDDYEEGTCTFSDASGGTTVTDTGSTYTKVGRLVTVVALMTYGGAGNGSASAITGLPFTCRSNSSCIALGNTAQAAGLAFVPTLNSSSGGFSTITGTPTAVINSALNSTALGFVLTYFTDT